ncbi:MAG: LPXTG cell wall anchor domain-containing protein, partial [Bifidobacterium criceti]|nr:LPXTG cell wall anchor domain-containing protein [Bifidobacterium criceti]
NVKPEFTVTIDKDGNVSFTQDAWHLVDPQTVTVKNVKSVTQLPLTGAAGITMLVVVALLLGGAGALIAIRSNSLKRQLNA